MCQEYNVWMMLKLPLLINLMTNYKFQKKMRKATGQLSLLFMIQESKVLTQIHLLMLNKRTLHRKGKRLKLVRMFEVNLVDHSNYINSSYQKNLTCIYYFRDNLSLRFRFKVSRDLSLSRKSPLRIHWDMGHFSLLF